MGSEEFNISMRKFLKLVGITSQREIEAAVRAAMDAGKAAEGDKVKARIVLTIDELGLSHSIEGDITVGDAG